MSLLVGVGVAVGFVAGAVIAFLYLHHIFGGAGSPFGVRRRGPR